VSKSRILLVLLLVTLAFNILVPRPHAPEITLHADLVPILGLRIPNTIIATWLSALVLISISYFATRNMQLVPTGLQNVVEWVIEFCYNFAKGVMKEKTRAVFPVAATIFFFILISNWMGLLPGFGSVGIIEVRDGQEVLVPFLRSANTDLNTTVALAIIAVFSTQIFSVRFLGLSAYVRRFLNFKTLIGAIKNLCRRKRGEDNLIVGVSETFVGFLEIFGELTKILSFSFRLFGNIFAGEVLMTVIAFLLPIGGPLPFMGLEIFVGFIQALIFALLTLVFTSVAASHPGEGRNSTESQEIVGV